MSETTFRLFEMRVDDEHQALVLTLTTPQVRSDEVADSLRDEFVAALDSSGLKKVVLDYRRVVFVSSAGLRPLIRVRRKVQELGGQLRICGLTPHVAEVFRTTRIFSTPFEVQPDLPAALASFAA